MAREVIDPANPRCLARNFDPRRRARAACWAGAARRSIVARRRPSRRCAPQRREPVAPQRAHVHRQGGRRTPSAPPTTTRPSTSCTPRSTASGPSSRARTSRRRTYAIDGSRTFLGLALDYVPDVPLSLATVEDIMDMGLGFKPETKEGMPMTRIGTLWQVLLVQVGNGGPYSWGRSNRRLIQVALGR